MGLSSILKKAVRVVDKVVSPFTGVSNFSIGAAAAPLAAGPTGFAALLNGGIPDINPTLQALSGGSRSSQLLSLGQQALGMAGFQNASALLGMASPLINDSGDVVNSDGTPVSDGGGMVPVAGAVARAGALIVGAGGRILGLITSAGRRISVAKVAQIAKSFGIQTAAAALGVTAIEVAQAVMQDATKKRRRNRGITPRDMRVTGRTVNKLNRMHAKIAQIARRGCGRR